MPSLWEVNVWWHRFKNFIKPFIPSDSQHSEYRKPTHTTSHKLTFTGTHKHQHRPRWGMVATPFSSTCLCFSTTLWICFPRENYITECVTKSKTLNSTEHRLHHDKKGRPGTSESDSPESPLHSLGDPCIGKKRTIGVIPHLLWLLNQISHVKHLLWATYKKCGIKRLHSSFLFNCLNLYCRHAKGGDHKITEYWEETKGISELSWSWQVRNRLYLLQVFSTFEKGLDNCFWELIANPRLYTHICFPAWDELKNTFQKLQWNNVNTINRISNVSYPLPLLLL